MRKLLVLCALISVGFWGGQTFAQSANNDCANAIVLAENTPTAFDTTADTNDGATPSCGVGNGAAPIDIWFELTSVSNGAASALTCGSGYDTRLAVFDACSGNEIACNDDLCGLQSTVTWTCTAGVTVLLQVSGFQDATGIGTVEWSCIPTSSNDDCATPDPVTIGSSVAFTNIAATTGLPELDPSCTVGTNNECHNDLWWTFVATGSDLRVSTCNANTFDTRIAIYEGSCPVNPGDELFCADDSTGCPGFTTEIDFNTTAGSTYLIRIGGFSAASIGAGEFALVELIDPAAPINVTCAPGPDPNADATITWDDGPVGAGQIAAVNYSIRRDGVEIATVAATGGGYTFDDLAVGIGTFNYDVVATDASGVFESLPGSCSQLIGTPPANDECATATPLVAGLNAIDTTLANTSLPDLDAACTVGADNQCHNDVWFTFVATGADVRVTTCNANTFDTRIAVYLDVCPGAPGSELFCADDTAGCPNFTTEIDFSTTAGSTYIVRVGGFSDAQFGPGEVFFGEVLTITEPVNLVCAPGADPDNDAQLTWDDGVVGAGETPPNAYIISRDGVDIDTVMATGGGYTYDDLGVGPGVYTYGVRGTDGIISESAEITCSVTLGSPPANDLCANALVAMDGANLGTLALGSNDPAAPDTTTCGLAGGSAEVWYTYTATCGGFVVFDTCGTHDNPTVDGGMDTVLSIHENDCAIVTELGCDDDAGPPPCVAGDTGLLRDSVVELAMAAGDTVLVRVSNFNLGAQGDFVLNITCTPACIEVQNLTADYDCNTDTVTLNWDLNPDHASYDITRDDGMGGVVNVATGLAAGTTSFMDVSPGAGTYTYTVTVTCISNGLMADATSDAVSVVPAIVVAGETDLVLQLEGQQDGGAVGDVDSGAAMEAALVANGRSTLRIAPANLEQLILDGCLDLGVFETIWVMNGSFPNDYRHTAAELDLIAAAGFAGVGIYFESGDHWGFLHVDSNLDNIDGIEPDTGANIVDGDDTFTSMDGQDSGNGLDLSADFGGDDGPDMTPGTIDDIPGAVYGQDQTGTDFTDELSLTGTDPLIAVDPNVVSAGVIWRNNFDDLPVGDADDLDDYITGVYAINPTGAMISQSWEFGGFNLDPIDPMASDADRAQLAALYLTALGRTIGNPEEFIRGDTNGDGANNIADAVFLLGNLFPGGNPPNVLSCLDAADTNNDGAINIADAVALLGSLFGAPTVPLPAPNPSTGCGPDSGSSLGCATNTPPC